MAIDELSQLIHLPIDNVPGAPPPDDTPDEEPINPQKPNLTCTADATKTRAHRQVVGVENLGGKAYGKQLDCTATITSTQNNGIHGILFSQHTTFNRLNHLTNKRKCGSISIWGVDYRTSKSNLFNQLMLCECFSLKSILGSAMTVGLKLIPISLEHYTIGIFSNVFSSCWPISHFKGTSMLNWCTSQTQQVADYTAR
jgi:hypothetical protein